MHSLIFNLFFFNDTATTEIYTLSLHDALPISRFYEEDNGELHIRSDFLIDDDEDPRSVRVADRKSTRLNSSHLVISYAVFCLKKKNTPHCSAHCRSGPYLYCRCTGGHA